MQPDFSRDARIAPILTRIAQLPKKPRLLVTIDGDRDPNVVYADVKEALDL